MTNEESVISAHLNGVETLVNDHYQEAFTLWAHRILNADTEYDAKMMLKDNFLPKAHVQEVMKEMMRNTGDMGSIWNNRIITNLAHRLNIEI